MSDILLIKTADWELNIWTRSLERQQTQLQQTLAARGLSALPAADISFSPACRLDTVSELGLRFCPVPQLTTELVLSEPLFFENTLYEFEFVFGDRVQSAAPHSPQLRHKLAKVNAAFHFSHRHGVQVLRGSINFANDIGRFYLPLRYFIKGGVKEAAQGVDNHRVVDQILSFEVLSLKLDMVADMNAIYQDIDDHYPLWRFALARETEQTFDRSSQSQSFFPLLWLSQFEALRDALQQAVRQIINAPHSRLLSTTKMVKADRLKGKIAPKLAEKVREDRKQGNLNGHYPLTEKVLSVDTPENRFIKMVLQNTHDKLLKFIAAAKKQDALPQQQRLSAAFFERLALWQQPLDKLRHHQLFNDVGPFKGLVVESLVLQQKAGYATVYRIWQLLSRYLDVLGAQTSISIKPLAELYEVWCFLHIKLILLDLDFEETVDDRAKLLGYGLELRTVDGLCGAFCFKRSDGLVVRLAHEPIFSHHTNPVHSWGAVQKPDIFLEAHFDNGETLLWLFDAKYRLADKNCDSDPDKAPTDAINQMHRYRDALLYWHAEKYRTPSRPVFGGFALYPGLFAGQNKNNVADNPYYKAIMHSGIGAFALLPSQDVSEGVSQEASQATGLQDSWLKVFLTDKLNKVEQNQAVEQSSIPADKHFIGPSRTPHMGMEQTRYRNLTLVVTGAEDERQPGYYESFINGNAQWFHMRLEASERQISHQSVMHEVRYCAIAVALPGHTERKAWWLWPVKHVDIKERRHLTVKQTGKRLHDEGKYWVFELEKAIPLEQAIGGFAPGHHHMKLTPRDELSGISHFEQVLGRYTWLSKEPKIVV